MGVTIGHRYSDFCSVALAFPTYLSPAAIAVNEYTGVEPRWVAGCTGGREVFVCLLAAIAGIEPAT